MSYVGTDERFAEIAKRANEIASVVANNAKINGALKNRILFNLGLMIGLCEQIEGGQGEEENE